jgi:hypothetical protein
MDPVGLWREQRAVVDTMAPEQLEPARGERDRRLVATRHERTHERRDDSAVDNRWWPIRTFLTPPVL